MADDFNPIFRNIFDRAQEGGDEIIADIAYGVYKERKRDFIIARKKELGGPLPAEEVEIFHKTYDDGQIDLIWEAARNLLLLLPSHMRMLRKKLLSRTRSKTR